MVTNINKTQKIIWIQRLLNFLSLLNLFNILLCYYAVLFADINLQWRYLKMAKTYLDQIVDYPSKIIAKLAQDKYCVGFILNKAFANITEEDVQNVLENYIKDYQFLDETNQESAAYIWVEIDVNKIDNRTIKDIMIHVTIACHNKYMALTSNSFDGIVGNRRDNIVRFVDKILNNSSLFGIGKLKFKSVQTVSPINGDGFTARELIYEVPDFNIVNLKE